ncbi:MAG: hypothetical protein SFZ02_01220 [bacterium]|nr:hypothetical protein [bacterium]
MGDDDNLTGNIRRVGRKDRKKELDKPASLFPIEGDEAGDTRPNEGLVEDTQLTLPEMPTEPLSLDFGADLADLARLGDEVFAVEDTKQTPVPPVTVPAPIPSTPPVPKIALPKVDTSERYPPLSFSPVQDNPPAPKPISPPAPQPTGRKHRFGYGKWYHDVLALGFMIGTIALGVIFVSIWRDPWTPLNPLPPATTFVEVTWTPDAEALARYYADQTATAQFSSQTGNSATPTPITPLQNNQPIVIQPLDTPTGDKPFMISNAGVLYIPNANGRDCNWSSIAGTVTGLNNEPLDGYAVQIVDIEEPTRLNVVVNSGSSLNLGAGGFELALGSTPRIRSYRIQLFDSSNTPVSEPFQIITREECDQNVAVVNFVQVR